MSSETPTGAMGATGAETGASAPKPMPLEECVREYLKLAMVHPEKTPKTQRAQRDNDMLILGFNRAQETLRSIIAAHGYSTSTKALADVRADGQQQPITGPGGRKMWVAG